MSIRWWRCGQRRECLVRPPGWRNSRRVLTLFIHHHWSSAVYPTQAKVRLEWGTQPLLPVQGVGGTAGMS
jgi:hypothetical protein